MKAQLMLVASLAIAVTLVAALMTYLLTQATVSRINYPRIKVSASIFRDLTKELCRLSWEALKQASITGSASTAESVVGNFSKLINAYSLGTIYVSVSTFSRLQWGTNPAYSQIVITTNLSSKYLEVRNVTTYSELCVSSSTKAKNVIFLTVKVCRCGQCYYTPITIYNTNLTNLLSQGYSVTYTYLGNGVTEFTITSTGPTPPGPGSPLNIVAVEVTYDGVKVVVST